MFEPYFTNATIETETDPYVVVHLATKLAQAGIHTPEQVREGAKVWITRKGNNALSAAISPAKNEFARRYAAIEASTAACRGRPPVGAILHRVGVVLHRQTGGEFYGVQLVQWEFSMVSAGRHPKKEIAEALKRAKDAGLDVREVHRGHRWGEVVCGACSASRDVYSTPRVPGTHAKQIDRFTAQHSH